MVWISLIFMVFGLKAAELPRFLTKHAPETLRYISMDGRYAYVQKKPGVLGFVSSFRSVDFISDTNRSDFLVKASRFKKRLAIEVIPNAHDEFNLLKRNRIFVVDYGNSVAREVGQGKAARLHLGDEWISYYDAYEKVIYLQNLVTQKKYDIRLSKKQNPFFVPEVEMLTANTVTYTDINEAGFAVFISFNLQAKSSTVIYRSPQTATRMELCQQDNYLAIGEFPYDGVNRGSKILHIKTNNAINLSGYTTVYNSVEQDIGNIVCLSESIFFVKTLNFDSQLNFKVTEAVKLDLRSQQVEAKSDLKHVNQLIEMDGRVLIPLRGEFLVVEGKNNLGEETLRSVPSREELQIDL